MPIVETLLAGVAGTAAMSLLMTVIHRAQWANADMIRALGSLVTREYATALLPGLAIHLAVGIAFAFPYTMALGSMDLGGAVVGLGGVLGLVHGIVVAFLLVAAVSPKHPVPRFQEAGVPVAIAHVAGHVAYGLTVGLAVHVLSIHWAFTIFHAD